MAREAKDHWPTIEARVSRMCQMALDNGPVTARALIEGQMEKLKEEFTAAIEDEREWSARQYEF
jgi:hypothetical protein